MSRFWRLVFRPALSFNLFGVRLQMYEVDCAMHGAVNLWVPRLGWVCWHPTVCCGGTKWPWYFYVSPNATPWAATAAYGPGIPAEQKRAARNRRQRLGWVYDSEAMSVAQIREAGQ